MTSRIVEDPEARDGWYISQAYCYKDKCPARTEKEPWPHSDSVYSERKKKMVCKHCGEEMTWTFPASAFA